MPAPFGCSRGTLGNDGAGVIATVGGCSGLKVGDEVWGGINGAYAEYALASCNAIAKKPKSLSFVDAGSIPVVGVTSLECLQAAGLPSKKSNLTVVITSGQGGTGFIGIQIAKALGATRVIIAAHGAGIGLVKSLGADIVVDYKEQNIFDTLPDNSVDIVYDNFGVPGTADKAMHAIRSGGTFLVLEGGNGGKISDHPKAGVKQVPYGLAKGGTKELETLAQMFDAGKVRPHTSQQFGLGEVPQAFTALVGGGEVFGKIAVVPTEAQPVIV